MNYLDYLIIEYINLGKTAKGRKIQKNHFMYYDSYKIDSIEFIKKEISLDFVLTLFAAQTTREALKGIIEDLDLKVYKNLTSLKTQSGDYPVARDAVDRVAKLYPKEFSKTSISNFASNLRGILVFFQQYFRIQSLKQQEKSARYFVGAHPELITYWITNPSSIIFVGREIFKEESKQLARPPSVKLNDKNQLVVIYPKFTAPNKIKGEIKKKIRQYSIRNYVDITPVMLLLEARPDILTTYRDIMHNKVKSKLILPSTINPNILIQVLQEILNGKHANSRRT